MDVTGRSPFLLLFYWSELPLKPEVTKTVLLKTYLEKRSRAVACQVWNLLFYEDVVFTTV